ncbi:hypothetical protein O6H91_16G006600 [Diphasiastrum complanatum]|uniref:Uncharacterized protein n=1 Tax=Diphasiastrum complanatum TaxID=34168 RepID=A0ACC2B9I2_DIPCM|nr:hypothetical protein O6H91_16G006600 [Diphasiastrum complanatum]
MDSLLVRRGSDGEIGIATRIEDAIPDADAMIPPEAGTTGAGTTTMEMDSGPASIGAGTTAAMEMDSRLGGRGAGCRMAVFGPAGRDGAWGELPSPSCVEPLEKGGARWQQAARRQQRWRSRD